MYSLCFLFALVLLSCDFGSVISLFSELLESGRSSSDAAEEKLNTSAKPHRNTLQLYLSFLCHKEFWLFSSVFLCGLVACLTAHGLVYDMMLQRGISEELATTFVLVMGLFLAWWGSSDCVVAVYIVDGRVSSM